MIYRITYAAPRYRTVVPTEQRFIEANDTDIAITRAYRLCPKGEHVLSVDLWEEDVAAKPHPKDLLD